MNIEEIPIDEYLDKKFRGTIFFPPINKEVDYIIPANNFYYIPFIYKHKNIIYKLRYNGWW